MTSDYHPTVGCRILELDKQFTGDQAKKINILSKNNATSVKIELWDMSGDRRYETTWPIAKHEAHGVIVVLDSETERFDSTLDEWISDFCSDIKKDFVMCFSYRKDEKKSASTKNKQSREYPNLAICEVTNNMNDLLPHFNKLVAKILAGLN